MVKFLLWIPAGLVLLLMILGLRKINFRTDPFSGQVDLHQEHRAELAGHNDGGVDMEYQTPFFPQFLTEPRFDFNDDEDFASYLQNASIGERVAMGQLELADGQSFFSALRELGVSSDQIVAMAKYCRDSFNLQKLAPGSLIKVFRETEVDSGVNRLVVEVRTGPLETLVIRELANAYDVELQELEQKVHNRTFHGAIEGSLWNSVKSAGLSGGVATQLSQILSGYLGGGRSTQKGDRWQLVVEELWAEDQRIAFGDILAARYAPVEKPDAVSIYRFESEGAALGFYQEDGSTLDHIFQASPIPGARITSGFSTRFHPVLKVMKPHLGVDYSAPIGTPVRAIGDGRIVQMTYHENLGKMIKVRHGYGFETVYGHMRGFAGNAVLGQSIKKGDVIGYVGMTGRTTGPHLHFAMLQNKRFVNPVKIAVPKKDHLTGSTLVAFQAFVERIKSEMMIF